MTFRSACILALFGGLLGGCGRDAVDEGDARTPLPATLPGVYAGELPCSNCAAIEATLWLRPDGRFFLRQRLKDDATGAGSATAVAQGPSTAYALGRWHWDEVTAAAVLRGAGPERYLEARDEHHVELRAATPIAHVLARDFAEPPFSDRVLLDGESTVSEHGASFKECLTGLTLPVVDAGAYRELRRQHRQLNPRGKVALASVEGHFVPAGSGSTTSERLVVDRFITIKPGRGC